MSKNPDANKIDIPAPYVLANPHEAINEAVIEAIGNTYNFVILFDVTNGNPNGDPDAGNEPRQDTETGHGLVTDVCIKHKIRQVIDALYGNLPGMRLYIKGDAPLNQKDYAGLEYAGIPFKKDSVADDLRNARKNDPMTEQKIHDTMCQNFFDIRTFGAVMTVPGKANLRCSGIRGPVQLVSATSIDPIPFSENSITRCAITTEADYNEKSTEIGKKHIVPYGLYRMEGYISAIDAKKTGFSESDLELLWDAIMNMFEFDRSAARGKMVTRKLVIFKHDSIYGNAPTHKLFERVAVQRKDGVAAPRSYDDYEVTIDTENLPSGVTCIIKD